jgi:Flp pilus assembly CpaF family ATPase
VTDHILVKRLRGQVADRLAAELAAAPLADADQRAREADLINRALQDHRRALLLAGQPVPGAEEAEELFAAIRAALHGTGRLEPMLADPDVENIDINGCDTVWVSYADGSKRLADPVADSDEELIELVRNLAAYAGLSSRPFDTANPQLDLRLPDGQRLSAVIEVTRRPAVSIRRDRVGKETLDGLVARATLTGHLAGFLRAAVAARKNIMIAGATAAGKTTLLRGLANEIPPGERLVTIENTLELGLDAWPDLHPDVVAMERRLPNSEGLGEVGMAELVRRSLRMNPSRVIVGEVLGDEVVVMLNAMTQGNDGSLSTIHANSAMQVFDRLATYALQAEERMPIEATHMLIAGGINFVVFLEKTRDRQTGRQRRAITSVREINGCDQRVLSSEVFAYNPATGYAEATDAAVGCRDELAEHGWQPAGHYAGRW